MIEYEMCKRYNRQSGKLSDRAGVTREEDDHVDHFVDEDVFGLANVREMFREKYGGKEEQA